MDEKTKETELEKAAPNLAEASEESTAAETSEDTASEAAKEIETDVYTEETTTVTSTAYAEGAFEGVVPAKKWNKRLVNALIRVGAAFIVAAILLGLTKLSIFTIIKRPMETATAHHEEMGSFVKQDIGMLMGDLSEQGLSKNYMVAAIYDKLVLVHFTNRYLESADAVTKDTLMLLNGQLTTLDRYLTVEGTVKKESEELSGKLYDWFAANKSWMIEKGLIVETDDDSVFIADAVIEVDKVNSMSILLVYALTGLAAACLLYIIVELILMAMGFYLGDRKKKLAPVEGPSDNMESDGETEEPSDKTDESSDEAGEKACEDGGECINDEEKPENNGSSENTETEKTEEDK